MNAQNSSILHQSMRVLLLYFIIGITALSVVRMKAVDISFGAYYTKLHEGQKWETYSRTGKYADVVVHISHSGGDLVFWRGNSYLPYWKTKTGQWNLAEIVHRSGDGAEPMPDRANVYSHVEIITNTPSVVVVLWRYLSNFTVGNPNGGVSPNNFVDEVFTITPNGRIRRIVRKGTREVAAWNDPLNRTTQVLQLNTNGALEISRVNPKHSESEKRVKGNRIINSPVVAPTLQFQFNEGVGNSTEESTTKTMLTVPGPKVYWKKGISGTALEFDGYNTVVALPENKAPKVEGGSLSLEAWFTLGAYPWNWAPLIQQGDNAGYFLGVDSHGYPGFMIEVDGKWEQLSVSNHPPYTDSNHMAVFKWYDVVGTYNKNNGMMRLYINGKEVADKTVGKGGVQTTNADVRVGKAGILRVPTHATHDTLPSNFGIDGLIDEVKVYNVALSESEVAASFNRYNPGAEVMNSPDMQKRQFPVPNTDGNFGAIYTHLPYYETWDNLFRFGRYADVVVGFDQLPIHFVFWRGVSYIPMMVNGSNQWFTEEFNETGGTPEAPGDCEPMSDKACYDSHAKILENNPARVVVQWRYRLANPDHYWANYDTTTGWGDIADWYFYIYPDGVASVKMHLYTSYASNPKAWHEWDEQIAVLSPGQHPESVICKAPVMTLVDSTGKVSDYDWNPNPPNPKYGGNIIQMIHFTGKQSPFAIQNFTDDGSDTYSAERTWYSVFPAWNHWPIAQVNSSGRNATFPDRASHSSISNLGLPMYLQRSGNVPFQEKLLMEGMTDLPAASLTNLAKSWLNAPAAVNASGGISLGYAQPDRAYRFKYGTAPLSFQIDASENSPINNLCFEIRNWNSGTDKASLKINGVSQAPGTNFRQGINIDTNGNYTLIIWVRLSAISPQNFEITRM